MTTFTSYRIGLALTLFALLALVWLSLGVGIIGADGDPANRMYLAVVVVGILGAIVSRFKPMGMAQAALAMAAVQAIITGIALNQGLGLPWSGPAELIVLNGFFVAMFGGAAWLFHQCATA